MRVRLASKMAAAKNAPCRAETLTVDILDDCWNRCRICYASETSSLKRVLPFPRFVEIVEQHPRLKRVEIGGGAPFWHQDLAKMVKFCLSRGLETDISTSGEHYREDVVEAVRQQTGNFTLQFHLPAACPDAYCSFAKESNFDAAISSLRCFVAELGNRVVRGRITLCKENLDQLLPVSELVAGFGLMLRVALYLPAKKTSATPLDRNDIANVAFVAKALAASGKDVRFDYRLSLGTTPCPALAATYGLELKGVCEAEAGLRVYADAGGNEKGCGILDG